MDAHARAREIEKHQQAIRDLLAEDVAKDDARAWPPSGYYLTWHVLVGMMLGFVGAGVSLAFNAIGAPMADRKPLDLIRTYLTFPMGERALDATEGPLLTAGVILYLITGGLYGIAFHLVMSTFLAGKSTGQRIIAASLMGLGLWLVNFYGVLLWLQPLLQPDLPADARIVSQVPFWVAALTHLVFAWTMLLVSAWGKFDASEHQSPPPTAA